MLIIYFRVTVHPCNWLALYSRRLAPLCSHSSSSYSGVEMYCTPNLLYCCLCGEFLNFEFSHFRVQLSCAFRPLSGAQDQAVALVYEHGEGYTTKAVCVDKGLDFLVGEMTSADCGPLADNRLFRGGEVNGTK